MMKTFTLKQIKKKFSRVGIPIIMGVIFTAVLLWTIGVAEPAQALHKQSSESTTIANGDAISIGVAVVLSGPAEALGWRQLNSIELAVKEVNSSGGIEIGGKSYEIALIAEDSECDTTQAIAAANSLVNAGVKAVIGHTCSGPSNTAQSIYAAANIPMVSPSSTDPNVTEQGFNTTFRVIPRDDSVSIKLATQLRNRYKLNKAAVIEIENDFGNWATQPFKDTFISLGGTITDHKIISSMDDLDNALAEIKPKNPDAIYFPHSNGGNAGTLSKKVQNLGMDNTIIAWAPHLEDQSLLDDYLETANSSAEEDIAALSYRDTKDMPGYSKLKSDYIAGGYGNYGDEPQLFGAFAYDAAKIIFAALESANSHNTTTIRDEIANTTNHDGVVGTYIGFDNKGDVIPQWGMIYTYKNGNWETIWPYMVYIPVVMEK
jgi:branched-chain amino acid transport system substrate-binding protein